MNKKLIWGIVIVVIVIIGLFLIFGGDNDSDSTDSGGITIIDGGNENAVDLQTSDDVFNELDNSLDYVE